MKLLMDTRHGRRRMYLNDILVELYENGYGLAYKETNTGRSRARYTVGIICWKQLTEYEQVNTFEVCLCDKEVFLDRNGNRIPTFAEVHPNEFWFNVQTPVTAKTEDLCEHTHTSEEIKASDKQIRNLVDRIVQ